MISESELEKLNEELHKDGIEPRKRPWEAISRISKRLGRTIVLPSKEADFIFKWFEKNSKPGAHNVGMLHRGAYYYDSTFWSVSIPIIFGTVQLDALYSLHEMPKTIKNCLMQDEKESWNYVFFWADCLDIGFGHNYLTNNVKYNSFGRQLFSAGYEELSSATTLLLEQRPNKRAIMNCRMATEMLLKSFIALKGALTEAHAKKLSHNLEKIFDLFYDISENAKLSKIKKFLNIFPEINERYKTQSIDDISLFKCYCFAQTIGAFIVREFTDQNTLNKINKK
ncbi:hypothetical protein ACFLZ8_00030 [Planctomycetota bacterium]